LNIALLYRTVNCQGYGRTQFNRDDNAFHRHTKLRRRSFDYAKIRLVWNEPINITYITIQIGDCLAGDFVECSDSAFENSIAIHFDCMVDRAWRLKRWDNFLIPKPFSKIVLTIEAPYQVPKDVRLDALEPHRENIQAAVMSLMSDSEAVLKEAA
jgi:hypothetical protein